MTEVCVSPLGGGWEITVDGRSLGIFEHERQAMGIARRISDGSLEEKDIVRDPVITLGKRRK